MSKIIRVTSCSDCPFYERFVGHTMIYHTCHYNDKTVKKDFRILYEFCELEELED